MNFTIFHNIFFDLFTVLLLIIFTGLTYIAIVRTEVRQYGEFHELSVLTIIPCRGTDYELEENLKSITIQDYPDFKTLAVVDTVEDEALDAIRGAGIDFTVSVDTCEDCSGKVKAIATAVEQNPDYDIYVIADSDIRVKKDWLSKLISPFEDRNTGISTTFPYFNPVGGFWSKVKLVWGFVGLGMMESRLTRFGWGGSLAFRKDFLEGDSLEFFKGFISDDIALTKICKKAGKDIAYVREAMPVVNSPDTRKVFIEWANRQTALSIYSTRRVFYFGIILYGATILLFVSAIILGLSINPAFFIFLLPAFVNAARSVRRAGKMPAFSFFISFMIPFVYFYNLAKASGMNRITWRGRDYGLK